MWMPWQWWPPWRAPTKWHMPFSAGHVFGEEPCKLDHVLSYFMTRVGLIDLQWFDPQFSPKFDSLKSAISSCHNFPNKQIRGLQIFLQPISSTVACFLLRNCFEQQVQSLSALQDWVENGGSTLLNFKRFLGNVEMHTCNKRRERYIFCKLINTNTTSTQHPNVLTSPNSLEIKS